VVRVAHRHPSTSGMVSNTARRCRGTRNITAWQTEHSSAFPSWQRVFSIQLFQSNRACRDVPRLQWLTPRYAGSGPDRALFLPAGLYAREEVPEYLDGTLPGEYV
jgi:hypothetical protein